MTHTRSYKQVNLGEINNNKDDIKNNAHGNCLLVSICGYGKQYSLRV